MSGVNPAWSSISSPGAAPAVAAPCRAPQARTTAFTLAGRRPRVAGASWRDCCDRSPVSRCAAASAARPCRRRRRGRATDVSLRPRCLAQGYDGQAVRGGLKPQGTERFAGLEPRKRPVSIRPSTTRRSAVPATAAATGRPSHSCAWWGWSKAGPMRSLRWPSGPTAPARSR